MWDGKNGLEFGRYAGETNTLVADDLHQALRPILDEVQQREVIFKTLKVSSLREHNAQSKLPLPYLVLVIDEATFIPKAAETVIVELVARCGAYGVHPVIATQRPDAEIMNGLLRANLSTRIALPVSSPGDSRVVLNRVGADKLPKQPGRLLMVWGALQLITGCSRRRLLGWCEKYRQEGVAGLVDKRQGGNAAKLSAEEIEHLQTMMSRYTPNQKYGKGKAVGGEFWTIADVRRLVKAECKVEYKSATSYRNLLDKCEMSYQKTQGVYKNRSTQKVSEFEELLEKN
jgi:transposase